MSDAFYPIRTLAKDRAFIVSISLATALAALATSIVVFWSSTTKIKMTPLATVSLSNSNGDFNKDFGRDFFTLDQLADKNSLPSGSKIIAYTAALADICKNNSSSIDAIGKQFVVATVGNKNILGKIEDSGNDCALAYKLKGSDAVLVTSERPFPSDVHSYKKVLSVTNQPRFD